LFDILLFLFYLIIITLPLQISPELKPLLFTHIQSMNANQVKQKNTEYYLHGVLWIVMYRNTIFVFVDYSR